MREMWVARAARLIAIAHRRSGSRPVRMWLAGILAALIVAGCSTGATSSPSVAATAGPTGTASPTATPSEVLSASKSPTATLAPLTFVPTGSMQTARDGATATLLKNGKVLIAGGEDAHTALDVDFFASAELYDPTSGKFTKTGSMSAARAQAMAVLLADGRVLIAGGEGCEDGRHCTDVTNTPPGNYVPLASAEIYDPATGKFARTGSMTEPGQGRTATLLADGNALIAGFHSNGDVYDPTTGVFAATSKEDGNAGGGTATLLPGGKVLVTGASVTEAQVFDETSRKFSTISIALPAGAPKTYPDQIIGSATLLPDGRVLFFENGYLETYDPASGTCTYDGSVSPGGDWIAATATLLKDGKVLFLGGTINTAVLYDPTNGNTRAGSTKVAHFDQTATLLQDGSVLIAGGQDADDNPTASAELFKP